MKPRDSTDAEVDALEALCDRLGGFDDCVTIEWLDGCMAAMIAGPRAMSPLEGMQRLLGDTWERTFADPADVQQALQTVDARWNVLASQLDGEALFDEPDTLQLTPLLSEFSPENRDVLLAEGKISAEQAADYPLLGEIWAAGALETTSAFAGDWVDADADDDDAAWLEGCLRSLLALTIRDEAKLEADLRLRYPGRKLTRDDLVDEACFALQDLRCYWLDRATRTPPRRVEKPPGRNDPCPCGSGRKYKKCHGAPAA